MQCYRPPSQFFVARWAACILEEMGLGFLLQKGCFFLFLGQAVVVRFGGLHAADRQSVFAGLWLLRRRPRHIHTRLRRQPHSHSRPHSKHAFRFCSKSCGALRQIPLRRHARDSHQTSRLRQHARTHTKPRGCLGKSPCLFTGTTAIPVWQAALFLGLLVLFCVAF